VILERKQELAMLAQLLDSLDSSGGRVVLVRGEAGIGKSALIAELMAEQEDQAHILLGTCDDLLTPQPLGPFWDMARNEPSVAGPLQDGDRRGVLEAVLDLVSRELRPTILVLEDTQWADEATLDAIKFLGRRIMPTHGLLILTYRDGEVDTDHPLRQVIGELPPQNVVRMHLDHLSAGAVASMIGDRPFDLDEVMSLTGGNALFVGEVIASGIETVPSSVQDSVLARASKLSPDARRVLDLVSVSPGESERFLIDDILDPTPDQLTECERQGLLRAGGQALSFHHELSRRAIESSLSTPDRRLHNQRVLTALADRADPSRLVHHAREAEDVDSIIEFAPKAARAAMAIESHREAVAHFRTLEPYLDRIDEADRAAIVDDWAHSEFYLDNVESLDILARAIDLHRSRGDDRALARALTFAVRLNEVSGRPEAAEASSVEAVRILESYPPGPDLAFAVGSRAWLALMQGDASRAAELAEEAISLAELVGDEQSIIQSLNTKGYVIYTRGDPSGFSLLEESRRRAEAGGYHFEETRALINMTSAAADLREVERTADLALRAGDTAARYENRTLEAMARAHYAEALEWKGDWAAAEDIATEALGSHPHVEVHAGWVLGRLQARRGRPEARATLSQTWALAERSGEIQNLGPAAAALAEHMWLTGENDPDRIARLREVLEEGTRLLEAWAAGSLAFWLWELGELSEVPDGIAEPYRLVMEGKAGEAAVIWDSKKIPYERALALMHGDSEDKLEALEVLETLGATAVAVKLRQSLRDQGVAVPRGKGRQTRSHGAGLTARQAEVLELLDEGLSNSEIADRLFVSPRTVEHHVSAVLAKLDSTTREEAVATAARQGLLATR